ncbi:MAG: DUF1232 domain-containing protein [Acaryochloridaceae cyanobacterium SU_2_1]|nr:DUF1232 domain-containing protein [Acaryochloridaceae cyanobacterium SU_2_1]
MKQTSLFKALEQVYRSGVRNPKYRWFVIVGTLVYLASPLDISPDVLPGIGWIDDGLLATLLFSEVCQLVVEQRKVKTDDSKMKDSWASAVAIDIEAVPLP